MFRVGLFSSITMGLALLGVGCTTTMYQGDRRPDSELATIKTDGTKVEKIDGRVPGFGRRFKVLPGEHAIALLLDDSPEHSPFGAQYRYSQASLTACIIARPGHTYVASPSYVGTQWRPEFFDEDTTQKITTRPYDAKQGGCPAPRLAPRPSATGADLPPVSSVRSPSVGHKAEDADNVTAASEPAVGQGALPKTENAVSLNPPPAQVTQADVERLRASLPSRPAEQQLDPLWMWVGMRMGFSLGGDNLTARTMSDGSTRSLDAGKGMVLTFSGSIAPLWISDRVGFGAGIEFGWKYGGISASNGSASFSRFPLLGFLQILARLSDHVYILARGGLDKEFEVSLSGDGVLADVKADFTSNVGATGEIGGCYQYMKHLLFDATFRYTRVRYSLPGGSLDGSNGGLLFGVSYLF